MPLTTVPGNVDISRGPGVGQNFKGGSINTRTNAAVPPSPPIPPTPPEGHIESLIKSVKLGDVNLITRSCATSASVSQILLSWRDSDQNHVLLLAGKSMSRMKSDENFLILLF